MGRVDRRPARRCSRATATRATTSARSPRELRARHGEALVDEPGDGVLPRDRRDADLRRDPHDALGARHRVRRLLPTSATSTTTGKTRARARRSRARPGLRLRRWTARAGCARPRCGLERDRVLVKSSGEPTYLLPDLAYHRQKFARGFDLVIDVQGADHKEQFPFVARGVARARLRPVDRLELVMHQFVTLTRGGEQVKQSTRRATYVTVDELLEEVGADVFRFFMVQRAPRAISTSTSISPRTPTGRRTRPTTCSTRTRARYAIERKARERGVPLPRRRERRRRAARAARGDRDPEEDLRVPRGGARAADTREPHHLSYYLRELAGLWNPYQQDGKRHRVLSDDAALTARGSASRSRCARCSRAGCDYSASPRRSECDEPDRRRTQAHRARERGHRLARDARRRRRCSWPSASASGSWPARPARSRRSWPTIWRARPPRWCSARSATARRPSRSSRSTATSRRRRRRRARARSRGGPRAAAHAARRGRARRGARGAGRGGGASRAPAAGAGGFSIQVGAFAATDGAPARGRARQRGYETYVTSEGAGARFRVRVGPIASRRRGRAALGAAQERASPADVDPGERKG